MGPTIERPHAQMRQPLAALGNVTVDGARVRDSDLPPLQQRGEWRYYAEVWACPPDEQSWLIARLIDLAFDTRGALHLDVRVQPTEC